MAATVLQAPASAESVPSTLDVEQLGKSNIGSEDEFEIASNSDDEINPFVWNTSDLDVDPKFLGCSESSHRKLSNEAIKTEDGQVGNDFSSDTSIAKMENTELKSDVSQLTVNVSESSLSISEKMKCELSLSQQLNSQLADEECAQALLELAMSCAEKSCEKDLTCYETMTPNEHSYMIEYPFDFQNSHAKLFHEQLQQNLHVVHLDHNYYWTGDERFKSDVVLEADAFKSYCDSIRRKKGATSTPAVVTEALDDVEISYFKSNNPPCDTKPAMKRISTVKNMAKTGKKSQAWIIKDFSKKTNKVGRPWKYIKRQKSDVKASVKTDQQLNHSSAETEEVLNADDKFKAFNMLLTCLEQESMTGDSTGQSSLSGTSSKESFVEQYSSDDDDDEEDSDLEQDENGSIELLEAGEYKCNLCCKTFNKKRYLTKHASRMHPGETLQQVTNTSDPNLVTCTNCYKIFAKSKYEKHQGRCEQISNRRTNKKTCDGDLADCQFCHARMRRHLLVRHLAQEHCIDRAQDDNLHAPVNNLEYLYQSFPKSENKELESQNKTETSRMIECRFCPLKLSCKKMKKHMKLAHDYSSKNQKEVNSRLVSPKPQQSKTTKYQHVSGTKISRSPRSTGFKKIISENNILHSSTRGRTSDLKEGEFVKLVSPSSRPTALASPYKKLQATSVIVKGKTKYLLTSNAKKVGYLTASFPSIHAARESKSISARNIVPSRQGIKRSIAVKADKNDECTNKKQATSPSRVQFHSNEVVTKTPGTVSLKAHSSRLTGVKNIDKTNQIKTKVYIYTEKGKGIMQMENAEKS